MTTVEARVERLTKARDQMKELLDGPKHKFSQDCESTFSNFRTACVHLRRETSTLDGIENKEVAWNFICRFSKEVPFQHNRCTEVLRILLASDAWMDALANDPDADLDTLPPDIVDEVKKRLDQVKHPDDGGEPTKDKAGDRTPRPQTVGAKGVCLVVQHCSSAKVADDEAGTKMSSIGPGLVVYVTFGDGASEEGAKGAARFLIKARLSGATGWMPGSRGAYGNGSESVLDLCSRGEAQGILVIHQASLAAALEKDSYSLRYDNRSRSVNPDRLFNQFVEALRSIAEELVKAAPGEPVMPEIVGVNYSGKEFCQIMSAGTFMHTFSF
mmetsp:Transcript_71015/g.123170  ORF Transcript_71015/g.123170 Transcript_71015/m.123170 type:complete len:328 (+) Transcript_71015:61-1044(+)